MELTLRVESLVFACIATFCFGFIFASVLIVWMAKRPNGYRTNRGKIIRIVD